MPKRLVNTDRYTWPTADGKGLNVANRGDVIDVTDAEIERTKDERTTNRYLVSDQWVTAEEPVLVDPGHNAQDAAVNAAKAARRAQLQAEMDALGPDDDAPKPTVAKSGSK